MAVISEKFKVGQGTLVWPRLMLDREVHEYFYRGAKLSGITALISKRMGKNFDTEFVEEGRVQGSHVHAAIEAYIRTREEVSLHHAARWAVAELAGLENIGHILFSEVLVSDFKRYASAIDIVDVSPNGQVFLFDTKAGNFDRESVSWQLGIYSYLFQGMTGIHPTRLFCLSTKDKDIYPIIPRSEEDVCTLLYGKKKGGSHGKKEDR